MDKEVKEVNALVDEQVVQLMYTALIEAFLSLPDDIMKSTRAQVWMYNSAIRLVVAFGKVLKISKETLLKDLGTVCDTVNKKDTSTAPAGKILFEDRSGGN